uniref:Uncharacterized protein n=1 Tax=Magallana gigas TaxID=29159 RepID=K1QPE6_MAGGI
MEIDIVENVIHFSDCVVTNTSDDEEPNTAGMTMELKRQGQANIDHHPPISDADLIKMYDYLSSSDSAQVLQHKRGRMDAIDKEITFLREKIAEMRERSDMKRSPPLQERRALIRGFEGNTMRKDEEYLCDHHSANETYASQRINEMFPDYFELYSAPNRKTTQHQLAEDCSKRCYRVSTVESVPNFNDRKMVKDQVRCEKIIANSSSVPVGRTLKSAEGKEKYPEWKLDRRKEYKNGRRLRGMKKGSPGIRFRRDKKSSSEQLRPQGVEADGSRLQASINMPGEATMLGIPDLRESQMFHKRWKTSSTRRKVEVCS